MASPWSPREEGELLLALDEIEANPAARVVILTGAGGHFCAGGDVTNMRQRSTAADGQVRVGLLNRAVLRLVNFPLPTIAMVDGYAVGAGSNLALCCDLIVASERAQFGELFCKIGLAVDGGGTWLLPRPVGMARAKELVFTGDIIDAGEAMRIGLVNRVVHVADLASATPELAEKIDAGPPLALRLDKQALNRASSGDLAAALEVEAPRRGWRSPPTTTGKASPPLRGASAEVFGDLSSRPRRRRGRARSTESPAAPADGAGRWSPAAAALAGARPPDPASTGASRW